MGKKKELLEELMELHYELQNAMDAIEEAINDVENAKSNEEMLDAVNSTSWNDLLENADYIDGSISIIKEIHGELVNNK